MSLSFELKPFKPEAAEGKSRRVLVTGANGRIGRYFAEQSSERYDLRLMVREGSDPQGIAEFGEVVEGDLNELTCLQEWCQGIDTVVHLAANPQPDAPWEDLVEPNVMGAYHCFRAAQQSGCRRVVYASSIHAVSGYPVDFASRTVDPVNPGDLYGVTKCFGEALGRYFAGQEGLSVIALRIGAFQPLSTARRADAVPLMDAFVSQRDLTQLIHRCIDDERLHFAIFNALSNNRFKRMDISDAAELVGYEPQDDFARENPDFREAGLDDESDIHAAGAVRGSSS